MGWVISQAGIINISGGGGGGTPVQTLTGNSGGAVPPTANNINIIGSGGVTVTGNPGTSTLTITVADTLLTGTATTTGHTNSVINVNIPLPLSNSAISVRANIVGYDLTANLSVGGELIGLVRNVGGVLTVVNVDVTQNDDMAVHDATWTLVTSGTNVQVQVTGTANGGGADVIHWTSVIDYVITS